MKNKDLLTELLALLGDPISSDTVTFRQYSRDEMNEYKVFVIQSLLKLVSI